MKRLLITGAAGNLGAAMRPRLRHLAETLRLSDMADMGTAAPHEEIVRCDLGDRDAVFKMVEGCDGIVHFGGRAVEGTWSVIRNANLDGVYNLYEAVRAHGSPRVVFASTNHTVGFFRQDQVIDNTVYPQPDGLYGVSKVFGEMMASMYWNKFGIETACVRIGYSFEEPNDRRTLKTYFSFDDFARLIETIFAEPRIGCPVIYGVSDNRATFWDNSRVSWLGWRPQDTSDPFRARIEAEVPRPAPDAPEVLYHGGAFTVDGIHED